MIVKRLSGGDFLILFKGCPRCGGDVDASYKEDVFCIQCGFRPPVAVTETGLPNVLEKQVQAIAVNAGRQSPPIGCPRCALEDVIPLEKLRPHYNVCYRCRSCGHIFSPGVANPQSNAGVVGL